MSAAVAPKRHAGSGASSSQIPDDILHNAALHEALKV
jgi:hypothetical protein